MGKGISIRSYRNRLALSNFNNLGRVPLRELNPETMARAEINHEMLFVPKTSSLPSEQGQRWCGSAILPATVGALPPLPPPRANTPSLCNEVSVYLSGTTSRRATSRVADDKPNTVPKYERLSRSQFLQNGQIMLTL